MPTAVDFRRRIAGQAQRGPNDAGKSPGRHFVKGASSLRRPMRLRLRRYGAGKATLATMAVH